MYATGGMEGDHSNAVQVPTGGKRVLLVISTYAITLSLFMYFSYDVLFYL